MYDDSKHVLLFFDFKTDQRPDSLNLKNHTPHSMVPFLGVNPLLNHFLFKCKGLGYGLETIEHRMDAWKKQPQKIVGTIRKILFTWIILIDSCSNRLKVLKKCYRYVLVFWGLFLCTLCFACIWHWLKMIDAPKTDGLLPAVPNFQP